MKSLINIKTIVAIALLSVTSVSTHAAECPDLLKFVKRKLNSQDTVNMCDAYQGKTILFVNTASYCGFTPQFEGLETLYSKYQDKGFVVLGFPSHDFNQEDKSEVKTGQICRLTYGVKFPMFEAMSVKGDDVDPLYRMLANKSGQAPKWNFFKYLMDKNGNVVNAYASAVKPTDEALVGDIEKALQL
ncbi:glutathione peroxidase [Paraglaciecola psychrophila]|uniref:Glutathione peroxidase n=1 Tax=Paraglaciecola psychrophila 170 TaxID=1129794 RepID=K6YYA3_9ALTE|nr:glutathione peroxidase [Paraglaciecola psychrophila]AGH46038.1 glutathione peroxidase [Paraglaciecola psychrophila 170]GAC37714.1 glutathione peroxidase homolog BsaA [Paraglaciecola psychrophila 170]